MIQLEATDHNRIAEVSSLVSPWAGGTLVVMLQNVAIEHIDIREWRLQICCQPSQPAMAGARGGCKAA
jgi:hypothetical protein